MRKIILTWCAACVVASSAMASDMAFTLNEAQQNCAALKTIKFTQVSPGIIHGKGSLSGTNEAGVPFTSWNINTKSKYVMQPKNNLDITFENRNGYGHKVGNVITCFYIYTGFTSITVHPCLTTAHTL